MHGKNTPTRPSKRRDPKRSAKSKHETLMRKQVRAVKYRELDTDALLTELRSA